MSTFIEIYSRITTKKYAMNSKCVRRESERERVKENERHFIALLGEIMRWFMYGLVYGPVHINSPHLLSFKAPKTDNDEPISNGNI